MSSVKQDKHQGEQQQAEKPVGTPLDLNDIVDSFLDQIAELSKQLALKDAQLKALLRK